MPNSIYFIYRILDVSIRKGQQNYIIVCFALVLPSNGSLSCISIAFFDTLMKRSRPTSRMIHPLNAQQISANTLVLRETPLFAIMASLTKSSLSTLKRQLKKIQVWKWQKRRLRRHLPHLLIYQQEGGDRSKSQVKIMKPPSSA